MARKSATVGGRDRGGCLGVRKSATVGGNDGGGCTESRPGKTDDATGALHSLLKSWHDALHNKSATVRGSPALALLSLTAGGEGSRKKPTPPLPLWGKFNR